MCAYNRTIMRRANYCLILGSGLVFIYLSSMWISSSSDTEYLENSYEKLIQQILGDTRKQINEEMRNYRYPAGKYNASARYLEDLVPEQGGNPIRTVIITTWRSGSTFLGEVVSSHPGTYYYFEPLLPMRIVQIGKGSPMADESYSIIHHLLHCNYTGLSETYLSFGKEDKILHNRNNRLWNALGPNKELIFDAAFLSNFCRLFPFQNMKVVRLRLAVAAKLLEDKSLNVRMILLVRDPRGTMNSRWNLIWCGRDPKCYETKQVCTDLVEDYWSAVKLKDLYSDRFRILRYEDLSENLATSTQSTFEFLRLSQGTADLDDESILHPDVIRFLNTHTNETKGGIRSTHRDTKKTPFNWIKKLNLVQISKIQSTCREAMRLWGYNEMAIEESPGKPPYLSNPADMEDFNPVGNFV